MTFQLPDVGAFTDAGRNALAAGASAIEALMLKDLVTQGTIYHVKPYSGNDYNDGLSPSKSFKTLAYALSKATANQNDIIVLYSESNTAANTTDYQLTTLTWDKNGVHLVGICAGGPYNKRARVAWNSATAVASTLNPLFLLSASNCLISNISFNVGVNNAYATGVKVTGDNNRFYNCDIAFPTHDAVDAAGGYALMLDGCDQSSFERCTFGSFTTDIGSAANSLVLIDSGCSMVKFIDCDFIERIQHTTNSPAVKTVDANALGFGCVWFKRCNFMFTSVNGAYAAAAAMTITAAQVDGRIVLSDCHTNAAKWDNSDANMILNGCSPIPIGDTAGVTLAV